MKSQTNLKKSTVVDIVKVMEYESFIRSSIAFSYPADEVTSKLDIPRKTFDTWSNGRNMIGYNDIKAFARSNSEFINLNTAIDRIENSQKYETAIPNGFMGIKGAPYPDPYKFNYPSIEIMYNRFYAPIINMHDRKESISNELSTAIAALEQDIDNANEYLNILKAMHRSIQPTDIRKVEDN